MKDVIIVSGGNIQRDFALDFLKKNKTEKVDLIAADRGVEFFKGTDWQPEVAVGDFDSLSEEGRGFLRLQIGMPKRELNYALERIKKAYVKE